MISTEREQLTIPPDGRPVPDSELGRDLYDVLEPVDTHLLG